LVTKKKTATAGKKDKQVIGRKEKIGLPDFGLKHLDAKIDTGAYSSSLHCRILGESIIDDMQYVSFIPLAKKYRARNARQMLIPVYKRKTVRSSTGHSEERYFIRLKVQVGKKIYDTEFSLSDRSSMKYTILLGRKFLKKRFLVDVSKSYIFFKQEKRAEKKRTQITD
jgi:hypothetical protein